MLEAEVSTDRATNKASAAFDFVFEGKSRLLVRKPPPSLPRREEYTFGVLLGPQPLV